MYSPTDSQFSHIEYFMLGFHVCLKNFVYRLYEREKLKITTNLTSNIHLHKWREL